ncbi:10093_t:CDS:2 [Entrophospora sp. SA101]|nr:10093_t:CDS:2 [Entrophospora sp. SA101]
MEGQFMLMRRSFTIPSNYVGPFLFITLQLVMEKEVSTRGEVKFDNDKIQILKRKLREIMQTMPSPPNTKQEKRGFQLIFSKIFSPTSLSWMAANYTFF